MDYFDIYMDYFDIYIEYSAARMGAGILGILGQKNGFTEIFFSAKPSHSTHLHIWNPM